MLAILLSLAISAAEPPQFVIIVDDLPQSQFFQDDLRIDFNSVGHQDADYETFRYISYVQEVIIKNSIVIHYTEITKLNEYGVPNLPKYPALRIHRYGEYMFFDDIIYERGFPLLCIKRHLDEYYDNVSLDEWKKACDRIRQYDDMVYINKIWDFLMSIGQGDEINSYYDYDRLTREENITVIKEKYDLLPDFPIKQITPLPDQPIKLFPWQEDYKMTQFFEFKIGKK